jgi:hypothetical protein
MLLASRSRVRVSSLFKRAIAEREVHAFLSSFVMNDKLSVARLKRTNTSCSYIVSLE